MAHEQSPLRASRGVGPGMCRFHSAYGMMQPQLNVRYRTVDDGMLLASDGWHLTVGSVRT
jgi:hypothetical protein